MTTISDPETYLAALPADQRDALTRLRLHLRRLLPDAAEVMSYAMPGFRIGKKMIAGYAGFARHCGLYPHSGGIIPGFAAELDALGFKHSKSGVLFTPTHPLPDELVGRIIAARLAEVGLT